MASAAQKNSLIMENAVGMQVQADKKCSFSKLSIIATSVSYLHCWSLKPFMVCSMAQNCFSSWLMEKLALCFNGKLFVVVTVVVLVPLLWELCLICTNRSLPSSSLISQRSMPFFPKCTAGGQNMTFIYHSVASPNLIFGCSKILWAE